MSLLQQHLAPERLRSLLDSVRWYHHFDFPGGYSVRGAFDLKPTIPYYHFPDTLAGKRVLDIGTADGYLAFEAERRGANAVGMDTLTYDGSVAIDASPSFRQAYAEKYAHDRELMDRFPDVLSLLNMPGMNRFLIARDMLGAKAEFRNGSIYDLKASGEKYDVVICGALVEHLKDPLGAVENLAAATGSVCIITLSNAIIASNALPDRIRRRLAKWLLPAGEWTPEKYRMGYYGNVSGGSFFRFHPEAFRQALLASGFKRVDMVSEYRLLNEKGGALIPHVVLHAWP